MEVALDADRRPDMGRVAGLVSKLFFRVVGFKFVLDFRLITNCEEIRELGMFVYLYI